MQLATPLDTSSAASMNVTLMYMDGELDGAGDAPYYWNDSSGNWDLAGEINVDNGAEETWLAFSNITTDSQYFHTGFNIKIMTTLDGGGGAENLWIDNVNISYTPSADTTPPTIIFISPTNSTFKPNIDYNATITDTGVATVLFSIDGSI